MFSFQFSDNAEAPSSRLTASFFPVDPESGERGLIESRHLSPVELKERSAESGPCRHAQGQRCSDKGFLAMSVADYLSLLDWTARQVRSDKQGATPQHLTPQHLAPIFDRLGVSSEVWCHHVTRFGKLFSLVAGQPTQIDGHRSKSNSHRYRARREARDLLSSV